MTKYVAIDIFEDVKDNNTRYEPGTIYPRKGVEVDEDRIKELSSTSNRLGKRLITQLVELEPKKKTKKSDKVEE